MRLGLDDVIGLTFAIIGWACIGLSAFLMSPFLVRVFDFWYVMPGARFSVSLGGFLIPFICFLLGRQGREGFTSLLVTALNAFGTVFGGILFVRFMIAEWMKTQSF